jgi:Helix-turn-helix domain
MSPAGPRPAIRLVLLGMAQFMNSDGSSCFVGVRRLHDITGFDKTTVARHRKRAVELGWLLPSDRPRNSRSREFCAALPDGVTVYTPIRSRRSPIQVSIAQGSADRGQSLSGKCGHKDSRQLSGECGQSQNPLSAICTSSVRKLSSDCPRYADIPVLPVNTLKSATSDTSADSSMAPETESAGEEMTRERLDVWIRSDNFAQVYHLSPELLVKLTPPNCRFPGYEALIREAAKRVQR